MGVGLSAVGVQVRATSAGTAWQEQGQGEEVAAASHEAVGPAAGDGQLAWAPAPAAASAASRMQVAAASSAASRHALPPGGLLPAGSDPDGLVDDEGEGDEGEPLSAAAARSGGSEAWAEGGGYEAGGGLPYGRREALSAALSSMMMQQALANALRVRSASVTAARPSSTSSSTGLMHVHAGHEGGSMVDGGAMLMHMASATSATSLGSAASTSSAAACTAGASDGYAHAAYGAARGMFHVPAWAACLLPGGQGNHPSPLHTDSSSAVAVETERDACDGSAMPPHIPQAARSMGLPPDASVRGVIASWPGSLPGPTGGG